MHCKVRCKCEIFCTMEHFQTNKALNVSAVLSQINILQVSQTTCVNSYFRFVFVFYCQERKENLSKNLVLCLSVLLFILFVYRTDPNQKKKSQVNS